MYVCLKEAIELIKARAEELDKAEACRPFLNKLENMRKAEESVRNLAAHSLRTITEDMVKKETGFSFDSLDGQVRAALVECSDGMIKPDHFDIYGRMNRLLIEKAEESL